MNTRKLLIHAAAIADSRGQIAAPGSVLLQGGCILAAGRPESIGPVADADNLDRPDHVVLPSLVNVHAHLDLSHVGPVPFTGSFIDWIDMVRARRAMSDAEIQASVERGVELLRRGGTGLVGDIAGVGSLVPIHTLRGTGMSGVGFLEVFGVGRTQPAAIDKARRLIEACPAYEAGVRLGVQPHAPYSCGLDVYRFAAASGLPVSTHMAETAEELQFVRDATGPLAAMLRRFGVWDSSIQGTGLHPFDLLLPVLGRIPAIAAHLNYIEDRHIELLAGSPTSVAYCPRAGDYFKHPAPGHSPHRYRELAAAGFNVALGTDSLLCLDTADRISTLDEMRHLYRRDACEVRLLLQMATTNGAAALGFASQLFTLNPGPTAGLIAVAINPSRTVQPLHDVLTSDLAPEWIAGPFEAEESWVEAR